MFSQSFLVLHSAKEKNNFPYWTWFCHDEMERYFYCVWLMNVWEWPACFLLLLCLVVEKIWYVCCPEAETWQAFPSLLSTSSFSGRLNKKWCENCFFFLCSHYLTWTFSIIISFQIEFILGYSQVLWMKTSCGKIRSSLVRFNP